MSLSLAKAARDFDCDDCDQLVPQGANFYADFAAGRHYCEECGEQIQNESSFDDDIERDFDSEDEDDDEGSDE